MSTGSKTMPPSWLGRALVEGMLIVFAVVLGFVVNEWREGINDRRAANAAMVGVLAEIEENIIQLEDVVEYHEAVVARVDARLAELDADPGASSGVVFEEIVALLPRGIEAPGLSSFAWEHAQGHGRLDALPYELVAETAGVYRMQADGVDLTWRRIVDLIFAGPDVMREQDVRASLLFTQIGFRELAGQERYLISQYHQLADSLRAQIDLPAEAALAEASVKP